VWIFSGTLLAAGALVGVGIWLVYFPPIGESYRRISTDDPPVALTYDDGPNPPYTDQLLEIFNRHFLKTGPRPMPTGSPNES
jgi:peptidoglycan/xylan/chitin deacetylase (PgdA/CDA1 family)